MKKSGTFVKNKGKKKQSPQPRSGHLCLSSTNNDQISYVVGGYSESGPMSDVWQLSDGQRWSLLADETTCSSSPLPRFEFDGCLVGESIYLFGGFQSDGNEVAILNDLWVFDTEYRSWGLVSEECPAPERSGHVVVAIGHGRFIVHGGTCMGARDDMWLYDTTSKNWLEIVSSADKASSVGATPCKRWMHAAAYCESSQTLAIFGGLTTQDVAEIEQEDSLVYLNDLWIMNTSGDPSAWRWNMVEVTGLAPSPRDLPALMFVDGGRGLLVFGGFGMLELDNDEDDENENEEDGEREEEEGLVDGDEEAQKMDVSVAEAEGDQTASNAPQLNSNESENGTEGGPEISEDVEDEEQEEEGEDDVDVEDGMDGIEEDDDDDSIVIEYLNDAFAIDLSTRQSVEIDLSQAVTANVTPVAEGEDVILPSLRGSKLMPAGGSVIAFGGFDGSKFFAETMRVDLSKLQHLIRADLDTDIDAHGNNPTEGAADIGEGNGALFAGKKVG
jgi:Galactose oxidase, central domain